MRDCTAPPARGKVDVAGQGLVLCQQCYEPMGEKPEGRRAFAVTCTQLHAYPELVLRWFCGCDGLEAAVHITCSTTPTATVH